MRLAECVRTRAAERVVWITALFILVNLLLSNRLYNGILGGSGSTDVSTDAAKSLYPDALASPLESKLLRADPAMSDASNATLDTNRIMTPAPTCEDSQRKTNASDAGVPVDNCEAEIGRLQTVLDGLHREYGLESMRNGLVMAGGQVRHVISF